MNAERGFELHPGAASNITRASGNLLPKTILLPPSVSVWTFQTPFASPSLFPIKATNAEISPHDHCVFRWYAIILSPTHPTRAAPCTRPCSTVAEAHGCSRPSFVNGNESPNWNKYQLVRQTARHRSFQNIVPIFVSRFPSCGRGFDSHRPIELPENSAKPTAEARQ